jgi:hypothetical protein
VFASGKSKGSSEEEKTETSSSGLGNLIRDVSFPSNRRTEGIDPLERRNVKEAVGLRRDSAATETTKTVNRNLEEHPQNTSDMSKKHKKKKHHMRNRRWNH